MSEQRFTLTPNQVTPLTGALPAGSTIINTDTTAAVWISADPNVTPGQGVRLGPKGSTSWTTDGAPVYACPDTGVTAFVVVTVSTDMAPPVNPVDVGVAVAAQLLAQGVPSVLLSEEITWAGSPIDVSRFASLNVRANIAAQGRIFYEYAAGLDLGDPLLGSRNFVIANGGGISFTTAVTGKWFTIGGTGGVTGVRIIGTNRPLTDRVLNIDPGFAVGRTGAWTAGTTTDIDSQTFTTNGGLHTVRLAVTGSAAGFLTFTHYNKVGSAVENAVGIHTGLGVPSPSGATTTEVLETVMLPPGVIKFGFLSATTATFQVLVQVTPTT